MLTVSDAEKLVHAFVTSRLDYCNALLGGCPASSINKLQIVQNTAARVLTRSRKYDHITSILQSLHWLPMKFRISYKILLLAYKALNDLAPAYLTNLLSRYSPTRSLRSQNSGFLVVPLPRIAKSIKGGITFSYLAPKLWNVSICFSVSVTRNYTRFSLDPTLKWSEMTKHLRRDDANPSEDVKRKPTLRQYTELTKFCHKLNILGFCNIQIYCRNVISCEVALQRLYREKCYTNNLELNWIEYFI